MNLCNCCGGDRHDPVFEMAGFRLVRCCECRLVFVSNPPDAGAIEALYASASRCYHAELRDPASVQFRRIARMAASHLDFVRQVAGPGELVDVGCSTGQFLALAHDHGFACSGIELSPDSAAYAEKVTGLPVERGTIHDSRVPLGSCDVVTMFDVIEHVPDPISDLAAAWWLLRPGGWLVLSTPNIDGLFPKASYPLARILNHWPHPEPPLHLYQFSVRTLSAMVARSGFDVALVRHSRIDLAYTFGALADLVRMPRRLAYAALFSPLAGIGPLVGRGDWFYLAARKPLQSNRQAA